MGVEEEEVGIKKVVVLFCTVLPRGRDGGERSLLDSSFPQKGSCLIALLSVPKRVLFLSKKNAARAAVSFSTESRSMAASYTSTFLPSFLPNAARGLHFKL